MATIGETIKNRGLPIFNNKNWNPTSNMWNTKPDFTNPGDFDSLSQAQKDQYTKQFGNPSVTGTSPTSQSLFNDIVAGKIKPSKDNPQWTGMYQNGAATPAQQEAYAKWEQYNNSGVNDAKKDLYAQYQDLIGQGRSEEEAMGLLLGSNASLGADPMSPDYSNNPKVQTAVYERELAGQAADEAGSQLYGFMGKLRKRWDTSIKKNLDSLSNLAGDPRYMQWLSTLGISPDVMIRLSSGRDNYINSYSENIRKQLNNDLVYQDNLRQIKKEAEKDYIAKAKIVNDEIERQSKNQDEIIYKGDDGKGGVSLLMRDSNTGEIYSRKFEGVGEVPNDKVLTTAFDDNGNLTVIYQRSDGSVYTDQFQGVGKISKSAQEENPGSLFDIYGDSSTGSSSSGSSGSSNISTSRIGDKDVTGQSGFLSDLQKADADFFRATGKHLQIGENFRTAKDQKDIRDRFGYTSDDQPSGYNGLAKAAPPGSSFHEKGLAVDISNWKEAAPYLAKYGIVNGLPGDMGHFSRGEMNEWKEGAPTQAGQSGRTPKNLYSASAQDLANYVLKNGIQNVQNESWWKSNPNKQEAWSIIQANQAKNPAAPKPSEKFNASAPVKGDQKLIENFNKAASEYDRARAKVFEDQLNALAQSNFFSSQSSASEPIPDLDNLVNQTREMYYNSTNASQRKVIEDTLKSVKSQPDAYRKAEMLRSLLSLHKTPDEWIYKSIVKDPIKEEITGILWIKKGTQESIVLPIGSDPNPGGSSSAPSSDSFNEDELANAINSLPTQ